MILNFFNTTKTDELADWIVAEIKRAAPLGSVSHKKKHVIRSRQIDDNIARRVVEFTRKNRLNIYTKARLAARVREGMSAHGYPKTFVHSFSFELIQRIQTATKAGTD